MTTTTNEAGAVVIDHVIGARGRLAVRLAAAEIRVAATDGDRVVVRTPEGRPLPDRLIVEPADGALTIREKENQGLSFGRGRRTVQLEIAVPRDAAVTLETVSGWLDVVGLAGEQRYRAVTGEMRLRACAGAIELSTVSGDATIELTGPTDLGIKSVSGDAVVRGGRIDALRIATTSGDIRVDSPIVGTSGHRIETLSGDVELVASAGMRVEARTISGDLTSDLPHRSEGRMGRRTLIVGDGAIELGFRSVSGDLRIHDGSGRSTGPVPPVPPLPPLPPVEPFSADLPDLDLEGFHLPDLEGFDLPDLDVAGFGREAPEAAVTESAPAVASSEAAAVPAGGDPIEADRMAILRSLETGELDVAAALELLAALDAPAIPAGDVADE